MQNTSSNYGIVDGKMAALIWLSLWDRYNQENTTQLKLKLFAELKEAIFLHQLPINFRNGLCGIAWGLIFLYSQEFIPDIDESILNVIYNEIHSINLSNVTDKSLYYGTAGIVAYYVCRELYNKHKINSTISNKRYFRNIRKECNLLINKSSEHAALYYSHLCKNIEDLHLFESFKPQLNDWMTFPTTIPQKPQYWSYSMDNGCLGYTVQILQNRTRN